MLPKAPCNVSFEGLTTYMMTAMSLRRLFHGKDKRRVLAVGFLTFGLVGLTLSIYGPALIAFQERFGIGQGAVGLIVSAHFLGGFTAIVCSGVIVSYFRYRRPMIIAAALLSIGAIVVALGINWAMVLLGAGLIGLGMGFLDVSVNLLVVRSFENGGAPAMNLLHTTFGVGAVFGPLLIAGFLPSFGPPFALTAAAAVLLAWLVWRLREPPLPPPPVGRLSRAWVRLAAFCMVFFFYVGVEVGIGTWEPEHLASAFGSVRAAELTALFWAALTVGRLISVPLSAVIPTRHIMLASSGFGAVAIVLAQSITLAPYAYALVGFALAPIFPTALVWLEEVFPGRAEVLTPLVVATANIAPIIVSPLIGAVIETSSTKEIPTVLAALTGLLFSVIVGLWWCRPKSE
jgi:FHS family glucose/mannose:H+ symporter-like MFS transporter